MLRSPRATRVELELFGSYPAVIEAERARQLGTPRLVYTLERLAPDLWVADIGGLEPGAVYGYRVWGPNWPHDPAWAPGSEAGFVEDVDAEGNRFCPNKLLVDPFAKVLTRDPYWEAEEHATGPGRRAQDSAAHAGKAVVVADDFDWGTPRPHRRRLEDTVVYEVNLRGMTRLFPNVPNPGTYAALAHPEVIAYLKSIGVTAVELLPVHESPNDGNDLDPEETLGKNYWGYMTLAYFAPDRRYAADQSADGPVREFKAMVKALHQAGLEVILDVVYNHHAEGGVWGKPGYAPETATVLSLRGVDNAFYYQLAADGRSFYDNTGIGANLRTAAPAVQDFLLASMHYWTDVMGVDGFRFDLCSVLGNSVERGGFRFQRRGGLLERIAQSYGYTGNDPAGDGDRVKLIAEPWAIWDDTYQVGNYPPGWAEWNGRYRDTLRAFMKGEAGGEAMREHMNGSYGLFGDDGRSAHRSVNFVTAHDGLTLFDLVSYDVNSKAQRDALNNRPWPFGPSDGGEEHNTSWNSAVPGASPQQVAAMRRQRARMFMGMLMLSNGTPMILGGDERLRTQQGNNNAYNLDNELSWLSWSFQDRTNHLDGVTMTAAELERSHDFMKALVRLRRAHPAFHKLGWWDAGDDRDGDGWPQSAWLGPDASAVSGDAPVFGLRLDASRQDLVMAPALWERYPLKGRDLYLAVNGSPGLVDFTLPTPSPGKVWTRVLDTDAWAEAEGIGNYWPEADRAEIAGSYGVNGRSLVVFLER